MSNFNLLINIFYFILKKKKKKKKFISVLSSGIYNRLIIIDLSGGDIYAIFN